MMTLQDSCRAVRLAAAPSQRLIRTPCRAAYSSPALAQSHGRRHQLLQPSVPQQLWGVQRGAGSLVCSAAAPETASASTSSSASAAPYTVTSSAASTSGRASPVDDFAADKRPVILFDGVCNLCNGGVNFMLDNDPQAVYRLAALQSPAGRRLLGRCGRSPDDISSIVLVEEDRCYIRSEAILRIGWRLRVPLPLLAAFGFPVPLPLRDAAYDAVANNRYSFFGRTDSCRMDDGKFASRFLVE